MTKKKQFPKIEPSFVKDQNGKVVEIYLKYNAYESIVKRMDQLKKRIAELKKKKSKKEPLKTTSK